jgi:mono/diheme cytochrome c family protein
MRFTLPIACALALAAVPALADEDAIVLKDGPGKQVVQQNCATCHSLDYIQANSPFLDHAKWEATVKKMINLLGAPISDQDATTIIDYLSKNYSG